jgi:hypothetical protein
MPRSKAVAPRKSTGERKPKQTPKPTIAIARQLAYYDPARPNMIPVVIGRPYGFEPEDDEKIKADLERFSERFAADPRCTCLVGVFEVVYKTQAAITRLRR